MTSRIIVKSLPKKISEEKLKAHFSKVGVITDAKLKYTKDGKFRQFAFVGFKNESDAQKAIEYFNNTYIDASKIIVESCRPLNDQNRPKTWSKHSKEAEEKLKAKTAAAAAAKKNNKEKEDKKETKEEKKAKKLERLIGDLKDDEGFKEFLAANKVISSKENIWKNDISLGGENEEVETPSEDKKSKKKGKKGGKDEESKTEEEDKPKEEEEEKEVEFENGRLFIRNLCYECKEEDIETLFAPYGPLVECSMPLDNFSKKPKGFAYITCMFPEKALQASKDLDGSIFQGRMLHIIPAQSKREMTEEEEAKLNFKQKKDRELKKKAQSSHNWNTLFINQNSLANLMTKKYNIDKSELYDVHQTGKRNKASVAVKLAVGETQIVNDIKKFLVRNGVKLDAFSGDSSSSERSKTVILIKNLPNETSESDLREFMKKNGIDVESKSSGVKRFVMPEYGIAALIEFNERQEARDAFKKMAYKKFKTTPLYLEWAPVDVFEGDQSQVSADEEPQEEEKQTPKTSNEKNEKSADNNSTSTDVNNTKGEENSRKRKTPTKQPNIHKTTKILVRNIPFEAKVKEVEELFRVFGELKYVRLPKKLDGTHRGFGFVDFVTLTDAERAFEALSYSTHLFGRRLVLEWAQPEQNQDVELLRQKESQISGPTNKRLKKSKLLDDLGKEDDFSGGAVNTDNNMNS